jgi:hypothetical protein
MNGLVGFDFLLGSEVAMAASGNGEQLILHARFV